jgi:hypothetical protein
MLEHEQELLSALANLEGSGEKPCGCHQNETVLAADPFAPDPSAPGQLSAELELALKELARERTSTGTTSDMSSEAEQAFQEFMEVDVGLPISIDEIIAMAERYPGLKITFSF